MSAQSKPSNLHIPSISTSIKFLRLGHEDLSHFLKYFSLPVVLALLPFVLDILASRVEVAEGHVVDQLVFEKQGVRPKTQSVVCQVVLAEILIFVGDIKPLQLLPGEFGGCLEIFVHGVGRLYLQ